MSGVSYLPQTIESEYHAIEDFVRANGELTYFQLDHATTTEVNLFALPENERFQEIEGVLDKIITALPALKRIFSKPITRLRDITTVLPVDAVRVINSQTMGYAASHTETWGDIGREGLKPKKLFSLTHEEDYKLYENILFTQLIDGILAFVQKNARILKDIMYSCQSMRMNLLERTNHLLYFLAVGKLHVGYAHAQDRFQPVHQRCLEKLFFIDKSLRAKLKSPVYRACKKEQSKPSLKKTNIFRLQKDYRQAYLLLKAFEGKEEHTSHTDVGFPEQGYAEYCTLLSLFAAGHFNFQFDEKEKLCFAKLCTTARFKEWSLRLERVSFGGMEGLRFEITKGISYSICLLFYRKEKCREKELQEFQKAYPADEYLFSEPFTFGQGVYLNLFDIDSFRRIQQLLLRCMVYADERRDCCPFCGGELKKHGEEYTCALCKMHIIRRECSETGESYYQTGLKDYKTSRRKTEERQGNALFADKETESVLFYRNITALVTGGNFRCPRCGKIHK